MSSKLPNIKWQEYSNLNKELPVPDNTTNAIHYVNAFPGSGKTHRFVHDIAIPHILNISKTSSILVYAAPSMKLLREVELAIRDELVKLGILHPGQVCGDYLQKVSSEGQGLVANQLADILLGNKLGKDVRRAARYGTVVLCSHECIAKLSLDTPGRERVVLVYDEARACLQDSITSINISTELLEYLTEPQGNNILPLITTSGTHLESLSYWTWADYTNPLPTVDDIEAKVPTASKTVITKIVKILEYVRNASLDVYVSLKYNPKIKNSKPKYSAFCILNPRRMFQHYARVLVLSANFKSTQMYHFLHYYKGQINTDQETTMVNLTSAYIDIDRMYALANRLQKTKITYILDFGAKETLTKTQLNKGMVVYDNTISETEINKKWKKLNTGETYRQALSYRNQSRYGSMMASRKNRDAINAFFDSLNITLEDGTIAQGVGQVVPFMALHAAYLYKNFLSIHDLNWTTLPCAINKTYDTNKHNSIWKQEMLDDIYNLQPEDYLLPELPNEGPPLTELSLVSHGLNAYQSMHGAAFLGTMKYHPEEYSILKSLVPKYDSKVARTIDYMIQCLWRCSVRDINVDTPVLLIVTDKHLAFELQDSFRKLLPKRLRLGSLDIITPSELLEGYEPPMVITYSDPDSIDDTPKRRKEYWASSKGKRTAKLQDRWKKESGYGSLSVQISKAKKQGNTELVEQLVERRKKCITFAEWRLNQYTMVKLENRERQLEKVYTVLQPQLWDSLARTTRLGLLAALHHLGLTIEEVSNSYKRKDLKKDWPKVDKWTSDDPVAYILKVAKSQGVLYKQKRVNNA